MVRRQPLLLLLSLSLCAACAPAPSEAPADSNSTPAPSAPADGADSNTTSARPQSSATQTLFTQDAEETNAIDSAEPSDGEGPTLSVGDKAPAVSVGNWIHGTEVEKFKKDNVYVVEFWATWCPPCRASMPHLSTLQAEYGDRVKFIGVTDEDADTVKGFLGEKQGEEEEKTWQEVVTYALALDKDSETSNAYMRAAGQNGIPTAFVVGKDGMIEWIGHPMQLDEPLKQVVDGSWDRKAFAEEFKKKQEGEKVMMALNMAVQQKDWDKALSLLDTVVAANPNNPQYAFLRPRVQVMAGRFKDANASFTEFAKSNWENSQILNIVAWTMLTEIPEEEVNAAEAMKVVERANELSGGKDGSVLDTLARAHYTQGNLEKAVEYQQKAVKAGLAGNDAALQSTLEQYQAELEAQKAEGGKKEKSEK